MMLSRTTRSLLICASLLTLAACASTGGKEEETSLPPFGNIELKVSDSDADTLSKALATGKPKVIQSSDLDVRLYGIPVYSDCVPHRQEICAYHYLLSISPRKNPDSHKVYSIGQVGEIVYARRIYIKEEPKKKRNKNFPKEEKEKVTHVAVTVANYPQKTLQKNKELLQKTQETQLELSADEVKIKN